MASPLLDIICSLLNRGSPRKKLLAVAQGINEAILAVPPERIKTAGEMVMVAGGAQKVNALVELLTGRCLDAPVDLDNLTLVTDAWMAQQVILGCHECLPRKRLVHGAPDKLGLASQLLLDS